MLKCIQDNLYSSRIFASISIHTPTIKQTTTGTEAAVAIPDHYTPTSPVHNPSSGHFNTVMIIYLQLRVPRFIFTSRTVKQFSLAP